MIAENRKLITIFFAFLSAGFFSGLWSLNTKKIEKSDLTGKNADVLFLNAFPLGMPGAEYVPSLRAGNVQKWNEYVGKVAQYVTDNNSMPRNSTLTNAIAKCVEVNKNILRITDEILQKVGENPFIFKKDEKIFGEFIKKYSNALLKDQHDLNEELRNFDEDYSLIFKQNTRDVARTLVFALLNAIKSLLNYIGYKSIELLSLNNIQNQIPLVGHRVFPSTNFFTTSIKKEDIDAWNNLMGNIATWVSYKNKPVNKSIKEAMNICINVSNNLINNIKIFKNIPKVNNAQKPFVDSFLKDKKDLTSKINAMKGENKDAQEAVRFLGGTFLITMIDKALDDIKNILIR